MTSGVHYNSFTFLMQLKIFCLLLRCFSTIPLACSDRHLSQLYSSLLYSVIYTLRGKL